MALSLVPVLAAMVVGAWLIQSQPSRFRSETLINVPTEGSGPAAQTAAAAGFRGFAAADTVTSSVADELGILPKTVRGGLSTERVDDSALVRLWWGGNNAELAPDIVAATSRAALDAYLSDGFERAAQEAEQATLVREIAQQELDDFVEESGWNPAFRTEQTRLNQTITSLTVQLENARADAAALEAAESTRSTLENVAPADDSDLVVSADRILDLAVDRAEIDARIDSYEAAIAQARSELASITPTVTEAEVLEDELVAAQRAERRADAALTTAQQGREQAIDRIPEASEPVAVSSLRRTTRTIGSAAVVGVLLGALLFAALEVAFPVSRGRREDEPPEPRVPATPPTSAPGQPGRAGSDLPDPRHDRNELRSADTASTAAGALGALGGGASTTHAANGTHPELLPTDGSTLLAVRPDGIDDDLMLMVNPFDLTILSAFLDTDRERRLLVDAIDDAPKQPSLDTAAVAPTAPAPSDSEDAEVSVRRRIWIDSERSVVVVLRRSGTPGEIDDLEASTTDPELS